MLSMVNEAPTSKIGSAADPLPYPQTDSRGETYYRCPICRHRDVTLEYHGPRRERWWGIQRMRDGYLKLRCEKCNWQGFSPDEDTMEDGRRKVSTCERR